MSDEAEYYMYMGKLHSLLKKLDTEYCLIINNTLRDKIPTALITKSEYYFGCYEIQYRFTICNNNNYIIINYNRVFDSSKSGLEEILNDDEGVKKYQRLHSEIIKINNEVYYSKNYNEYLGKLKDLQRDFFS